MVETDGSLSSRPVWSAEQVPGQPGLATYRLFLEFFHLKFSGAGDLAQCLDSGLHSA